MLGKVFQKQRFTVVLALLAVLLLYVSFTGLKSAADATEIFPARPNGADSNGYGSPVHLADLEDRSINESSGIAASRRNTGILWTHNDSGDGPFVYAFDRQGKHRGVWRVAGADAQDWEDMALGPGPKKASSYLYLGDIGDNSKKRDQIVVYRVAEPHVGATDASSTNKKPRNTEPADAFRLKYPDGKHDAETLLVHPTTGDLYIITKVMGSAAGVYKLKGPLTKSGEFTLGYVGEFRFPNKFVGFVTGGAVSPDGHRVALCDYLGACELILPDKPGAVFDDIWKQPPVPIDIGDYKGIRRQGEAICYSADGRALLATSERLPCPLIEVVLLKTDQPGTKGVKR